MFKEPRFLTGESPVGEFVLLRNCYYASRSYTKPYWCVMLAVPMELCNNLGIKNFSYYAVVDDFGNLTKVDYETEDLVY